VECVFYVQFVLYTECIMASLISLVHGTTEFSLCLDTRADADACHTHTRTPKHPHAHTHPHTQSQKCILWRCSSQKLGMALSPKWKRRSRTWLGVGVAVGVGVSVGVGFGVDVQSLFRVQGLGVLCVVVVGVSSSCMLVCNQSEC